MSNKWTNGEPSAAPHRRLNRRTTSVRSLWSITLFLAFALANPAHSNPRQCEEVFSPRTVVIPGAPGSLVQLEACGDGQVRANGISVTGESRYPLPYVRHNLELHDRELPRLRGAKVLTIAEGTSELLPFLLSTGARAEAVDLWYHARNFPNNAIGREMRDYNRRFGPHLIQGDARAIPRPANTYKLVLSHLLVNNINSPSERIEMLDEMIRVTAIGGEARVFGFRREWLPGLQRDLQQKYGESIRLQIDEFRVPNGMSVEEFDPWFENAYVRVRLHKLRNFTPPTPHASERIFISRREPAPDLQPRDFSRVARTPDRIPDFALTAIREALRNEPSIRDMPNGSSIAMNFSIYDRFELATRGFSRVSHDELLTLLQRKNVISMLAGIPNRLRLKYIEIKKLSNGQIEFSLKLVRDLSFAFDHHLHNGFAVLPNDIVRPFRPEDLQNSNLHTRSDLFREDRWQETSASCSIVNLCHVMRARGQQTTEVDLLAHALSVKPEGFFNGENPGLVLSEVRTLLTRVQRESARNSVPTFRFQVRELFIRSQGELERFRSHVQSAARADQNIDVIVNFLSVAIGRPGGGHFLAVAGYDPVTDQVLMRETNGSTNGSFWVSVPALFAAMQPDGDLARGYIVIDRSTRGSSQRETSAVFNPQRDGRAFTQIMHKATNPNFRYSDLTREDREILTKLGLAQNDWPRRSTEFFRYLTTAARASTAVEPRAMSALIDRYIERTLPHLAQSLRPENSTDTSRFSATDDINDLFRGYGYMLLPRNDRAFEDPRYVADLLRQRGQTAPGNPHFDPSQAQAQFHRAFARMSRGLDHEVMPIAQTLTGSDANTLFTQIADWVVSLKAGQRRDGKILIMQNSYVAGRGPLRQFRFFDRGENAPGEEFLVPAPATHLRPSASDLNKPLSREERESLAMIERTVRERGDIGGLLIEPVQSAGGVYFYRANYMQALLSLCRRLEIPILADEVFNGGGRTGRAMSYMHYPGFIPDYVTFGKGTGTAGLAEVRRREQGGGPFTIESLTTAIRANQRQFGLDPHLEFRIFDSTIDGSPDAMLKSSVILNRILEGRLIENAQVVGDHLLNQVRWFKATFLRVPQADVIRDVRGLGLLFFIDGTRYQPPITLEKSDVDRLIRNRVLEVLRTNFSRAQAQPSGFRRLNEFPAAIARLESLQGEEFLRQAPLVRELVSHDDDAHIRLLPPQ